MWYWSWEELDGWSWMWWIRSKSKSSKQTLPSRAAMRPLGGNGQLSCVYRADKLLDQQSRWSWTLCFFSSDQIVTQQLQHFQGPQAIKQKQCSEMASVPTAFAYSLLANMMWLMWPWSVSVSSWWPGVRPTFPRNPRNNWHTHFKRQGIIEIIL